MEPRARVAVALSRAIDYFGRYYAVPADLLAFQVAVNDFYADTFAAKPADPTAAVNRYQAQLQQDFEDWADDLAGELEDEPDDDAQDEIIAAALLALLLLLKKRGADTLPQALKLAFGGKPPTDAALKMLAAQVAANEGYLTDSLLPALRDKLKAVMADEDVKAAIVAGAGKAAIAGALAAMGTRVGGYASELWDTYNKAVGERAKENGKKIFWKRDPQAQHCDECLEYGDRTYDSYEALLEETGGVTPSSGTTCGDNCHCELQELDEDSDSQPSE